MKARRVYAVCMLLCTAQTVLATETAAFPNPLVLSLEQAQTILLAHNHDLLAAQRNVDSAKATQLSAAARPNPQLSINTVNINPHGLGAGTPYDKRMDTVLRIDQLIERGDKRDLRMKTAQQLELASEADLLETTRQQRIALYNAFYDVALAQAKIQLTADSARLAVNAQQKAELRLSAGDIAAAEVARLRVDTLRAQNDADQAVADAANVRITLAYLLGLDKQAGQIQVIPAWPEADQSVARLYDRNNLITRRADMQAAKARVEAALQYKALIRAQRTRDVFVGVQVEHYPAATENTVGLGISVPLYLGNNFAGDIRNAEVSLSMAEDNLERTRALALGELNGAQSALTSSQARLQRYQVALLPSARKAMDAAEFGFANGALSAIELLDARRTWRAIQLEALNAQSDFARALAIWRVDTQIGQE